MAEPAAEVIVNLPLPCGCVVSQKYVALGVVRGEEEAKLVLQFGADRLKLWAEQRAFPGHKCPPRSLLGPDPPRDPMREPDYGGKHTGAKSRGTPYRDTDRNGP